MKDVDPNWLLGSLYPDFIVGGEDGCAVSDALPAGHYWVRELTAPEGYVVSTKIYGGKDGLKIGAAVESVTVTADENVKPKPRYVYIYKQSCGSGAAVTGAVLVLSNAAGDQVDTWTTAEEPHRLKNLPDGVYTLTETKTPAEQGYVMAAPVTFTIRDGLVDGTGENVVMEDDYTKLDISKTDIATGEELPGAHLVLKDADGNVVDDFVSTDQPHRIEQIAPGRYTLTEMSAPEGYVISETAAFEVKSTGEVQKVTMKDDYTKLEISKTDIATGEELPGAHLVLKDADGNVVDDFVSTDQPHRIERIAPGRYTLTETSAPEGYVITEAVKFEVGQIADVQKVEMKDDYTKLDISKTDITTGEELPGAHLTILDQDGNTVEEFVSGSEPHRIERIAPGSYTLIETSAPDGYVITEAVKFDVEQIADVQKVEMKDDYTKLDISKTDITTGEELPGAHLVLKDADGNVVDDFISTDQPHRIERIAPGTYTLTETSAPEGYIIAETVTFDVEQIADVQKVEMKDDYTKLDISKTDITTGEELPGAHLVLKDADGNVVDDFISTDQPYRIERIAPGSYTLTETAAPSGYLESASVDFTVTATGEIQKVSMKDAPVPETPSPQNQVKVLGITDSSPVIGAALIGGGILLLAALVFAVRKFFDRNK
ncbi:MAG: SpaA isopeptide-forming pilin-related protein [Lachnospiraceae bacterium]